MKAILAVALTLAMTSFARAQSLVQGSAIDITPQNHSVTITTGNTFQTVLTATVLVPGGQTSSPRRTLKIQNNNTNTDNCFIDDTGLVKSGNTTSTNVTTVDGITVTSAQASDLLSPGGSEYYSWPIVPNGVIVATCAGNGDSIKISIQ